MESAENYSFPRRPFGPSCNLDDNLPGRLSERSLVLVITIIKGSNIWELNLFNTRPVQSLFQSESGTIWPGKLCITEDLNREFIIFLQTIFRL